MIRATVFLVCLSFVSAIGDAPARWLTVEERTALSKVCKHYVNRARFKARGAHSEFVVLLADGCISAQKSLVSGDTAERQTAAAFLLRLQGFRDVVTDMNMQRVFGQNYTPYTRISYESLTRSESVPRVSATGEFLIAHRMGLIAAYNAWLDTGPAMVFASQQKR